MGTVGIPKGSDTLKFADIQAEDYTGDMGKTREQRALREERRQAGSLTPAASAVPGESQWVTSCTGFTLDSENSEKDSRKITISCFRKIL